MIRIPSPGSARPEAFLDEAIGLHKVAEEVFAIWRARVGGYRWDKGKTEIPAEIVVDYTYFLKAYLLLSGLAMENLLKGAILARQPETAKSKRLVWRGVRQGGHELRDLVRNAGYEPSEAEDDVLEALTEAIVWSGRYPVPLDHSALGGRIYRLAKDRSEAKLPTSLAEMPIFHRSVYQNLFVRIFTHFPVSTEPHRLVQSASSEP